MPLQASAEEMQWFRDAKFGLFIHWGPCSILGVELSWGRDANRPFDINRHGPRQTDPVYDALYKQFNPDKFDAEQWVRIARDAGMKYIVLVTKHHDGFSMFHTKHSDYGIANTPFKRDIVGELADACHKAGMKLGLYYSPRDWYHPDYLTENHDRYLKFYFGQMEELCNNYGKVDIIWFDSIADRLERWPCADLFRKIRCWQPGIIMNNRGAAVLGGYNQGPKELWGDYDTPEQRIGEYQTDRPWESCITLVGHQWSYRPGGEMMTLKECINALVTSVCGDGNLLLNVGPMPTGEIEPRQVARLKEIGDFLKKYGESIYGGRGGPVRPGSWGGTTHKGDTVYVHVLNWDGKDEVVVPIWNSKKKIVGSSLLNGGVVEVRQDADGIHVRVAKADRGELDTVVKLRMADLTPEEIAAILQREARRSKPDYITYVPKSWDQSTQDSHNEHFLVFEGPRDWLMAVWTQSMAKPGPANRIVFSRSKDGGTTWESPVHVAGPRTADDPTHMASWGFPMVSKSGRIYVLYTQHQGVAGWIPMHSGTMDGVYSDDDGQTWSKPQTIPMPKSPYDDPEGKIPAEWIVWQNPMRDLSGGYFIGYSHWLHPKRVFLKQVENWTQIESVVEFVRYENIDENPEVKDIKVAYSGWGDKALRVPHFMYPELSIAQEPSIVRLPDDRLFCVMRNNSGFIWYSVSSDDGKTWTNTRPLLRKDFGRPILQPVASCPIYQLADGRYVLLHHNNRGDTKAKPEFTSEPRRPAFIALGEFRPNADQPIWFSESRQLMDNDGVGPDGTKPGAGRRVNTNIGVYSSFTTTGGNNVLWHPDRKCFLLGKKITDDFLADLVVPKE
ncbi:MAG TPA: alpha-L-fucosidase [Phycisphaerae bacterium]|nr:alpha-L-fucosidase [Phycisphaerae bacterium]